MQLKHFLLLFVSIVLLNTGQVESAMIFNEEFDTAAGFTTSTPFFSDEEDDFFGIAGVAPDFGGDPSPNFNTYTGLTDNYLVGEDLDGEGASLPIVISFNQADISNFISLEFHGLFAEEIGGIDAANDSILVEYQIDGGGFQNLLAFEGADFTSGSFNGIFRQDTDFNGTGDGTALSSAATQFSVPIAETGNTLDLRLTINLNAGSEDFAIDRLQITGYMVPEPSAFLLAGLLVCLRALNGFIDIANN